MLFFVIQSKMQKQFQVFSAVCGILFSLNMQAQTTKILDKLEYMAHYQLIYQEDSTDAQKNQTMMRLLIGQKIALFVSESLYLRDSVRLAHQNKDTDALLGNLLKMPKVRNHIRIYKNYPESNKVTVTEHLEKEYGYEELCQFLWQIEPQTDTIAGYVCQKATTFYAGRYYEAWFTNQIPVNNGPYKFQGLPGFITKVQDSEQDYIFELKIIQPIDNQYIYLHQVTPLHKLSKPKFKAVKKNFEINMIDILAQNGQNFFGQDAEIKDKVQKKLKEKFAKNNNPIELE